MAQNGPESLEARHSAMDYPHYFSKQVQPVPD
jgi:DNA polymerase-2